jgi:hypothetical protein
VVSLKNTTGDIHPVDLPGAEAFFWCVMMRISSAGVGTETR